MLPFELWSISPLHLEAIASAVRTNGPGSFRPKPSPSKRRGQTAVIDISGPLEKSPGFLSWLYGNASMSELRSQVLSAARDSDVAELVMRIDSPGGTVSGTGDLADAVAEAARRKKVTAYIEDCCCSGAYWIASQASRVVINSTGLAGSIGTFAVVRDTSKIAERAGLKVHVIKAGAMKGIGVFGAEISDEQIAQLQDVIDATNKLFLDGVLRGRRSMTTRQLGALSDARVLVGQHAVDAGLADAVGTFDETRYRTANIETSMFSRLTPEIAAADARRKRLSVR